VLRGDSETIVRVSDTGPGISEQEGEAVLRVSTVPTRSEVRRASALG